MVQALGKRSIASVLAVLFSIIRIILIISLVVVLVMLSALLLIVLFGAGFSDVRWISRYVTDPWPAEVAELIAHAIRLGVMLYVVNKLLEILATLRARVPFAPENAERFTYVAAALAIGELARYVTVLIGIIIAAAFYGKASELDLEFDLELDVWFAVLVVLVLAAVFREGARLKQEQDLTI
ncbi:MAG: hypothetical protein AAGC95_02300 [Pseudomonadota bacterium]